MIYGNGNGDGNGEVRFGADKRFFLAPLSGEPEVGWTAF